MKASYIPHLLFWAAILTVCAFLSGCANDLSGKSQAYKEVHEKTFWKEYKEGGVDAMAWANLKAHNEAERQVGK